MRKQLTLGLVLASSSLAGTAGAAEKQPPRIIAAHQPLPPELQHLPRIILGERHEPAPLVVRPPDKIELAKPPVAGFPETRIDVEAGRRVHTLTGAFGLTPAAEATVEPGRVLLRTGANDLFPATETRIERPFEINLGVGGAEWQIRPFDIRRVK
jgi:hypothetical protein